MHSYDLEGRTQSLARMAAITFLVVIGLDQLLVTFADDIPRWIDVPSFAFFFGLLLVFVNHVAWRWTVFRRLLSISVLDFGGHWEGVVVSTDGEGDASEHPVSVTIQQTWLRIFIKLEAERSHSSSIVAAWRGVGAADSELFYVYENHPHADTPTSVHPHRGTAVLRLAQENIEGHYYSGRDRQRFGDIRLQRARAS